jgi:hypothetical protein
VTVYGPPPTYATVVGVTLIPLSLAYDINGSIGAGAALVVPVPVITCVPHLLVAEVVSQTQGATSIWDPVFTVIVVPDSGITGYEQYSSMVISAESEMERELPAFAVRVTFRV